MSNQVTIQRRIVLRVKTGDVWKEAHVFDDYGNLGSVVVSKFPTDDIMFFSMVVQEQLENGTGAVDTVLQYLYETKNGVTIDGNYLDYKIIEPQLKNYVEGSPNV